MAEYFRNHSKIAFKLFVAACDELSNKNIVISPLALQICLVSIYISSSDDSNSKEILKLLQLSTNTSIIEIKDIFSTIFVSKSDFFNFNIFNKFYIQNGKIINDSFIKNFFEEIKTDVNNIEFNNNNIQQSIETINSECCKNTDARISQIVTANDFDKTLDTVMAIINAASLSASWDVSFYDTEGKQKFLINNNEEVEIDMMENTIPHFKYGEFVEYNIKIAELRYAGYYENELSMLVILPIEEKHGINEILTKLEEIDFFDICDKMQETPMNIKFPKFKMESKLDVLKILEKFNETSSLNKNIHFSNLIIESEAKLNINKIIHKAEIESNKIGTNVKKLPRHLAICSEFPDLVEYIVNRPFIYVIKDKQVIYFIGKVVSLP